MRRLLLMTLAIIPSLVFGGAFEEAEALRTQGKFEEAFLLYLKASSQGHPTANHWAGTFYLEGIGVKKDPAKAGVHFLAAAEQGVEGSMVYLANMYYSGEGFPKDCKRAEYWIAKSSHGSPHQGWVERLRRCE